MTEWISYGFDDRISERKHDDDENSHVEVIRSIVIVTQVFRGVRVSGECVFE